MHFRHRKYPHSRVQTNNRHWSRSYLPYTAPHHRIRWGSSHSAIHARPCSAQVPTVTNPVLIGMNTAQSREADVGGAFVVIGTFRHFPGTAFPLPTQIIGGAEVTVIARHRHWRENAAFAQHTSITGTLVLIVADHRLKFARSTATKSLVASGTVSACHGIRSLLAPVHRVAGIIGTGLSVRAGQGATRNTFPAKQRSPIVHTSPSSQIGPVSGLFSHPVAGKQLSAVHGSLSSQFTFSIAQDPFAQTPSYRVVGAGIPRSGHGRIR